MNLHFTKKFIALISAVLLSYSVQANTCQTSNVWVSNITPAGQVTPNPNLSPVINSAECLGAYSGIDQPYPGEGNSNSGLPGQG